MRTKEQDRERKQKERKLRSHHSIDRKAWLKKAYGIGPDEYQILFEKQGGVCAICAKNQLEIEYHLCVDHCHNSGKIRGLLCKLCNQGLGMFQDNPILLEKAIKYLGN